MVKKCNTCKEIKHLSEFRRDRRLKDGHQNRCKKCVSSAIKEGYHNKYKHKTRIRNKRKRDEFRKNLNTFLLERECEQCGEDHPATLDFHHLDPTIKEYEIGSMRTFSWDRVLTEIQKCVILCSNCHRKYHWKVPAGNNVTRPNG